MLSPETRPASCAARSSGAPTIRLVDALVHVAQPLLEPHDGLAVGGEAEMPGLDDAGVHRPDRDLVQRLALGGKERVGVPRGWRAASRARADGVRPSGRGRARPR